MAIPSNKPQNRILLVGGIVFALLAGVVVFLAVNRTASSPGTSAPSLSVVTARTNIPAGGLISQSDLGVTSVRQAPVAGYYPLTSEIEGHTAAQAIASGTVITPAMVSSGAVGTGGTGPATGTSVFAHPIPDNYAALAIPTSLNTAYTSVDQMTVGYYVQPGDQIDILARVGAPSPAASADFGYLFQDIPVLAVGYASSTAASPNAGATHSTLPAPTYLVVAMPYNEAVQMTAILTGGVETTNGGPADMVLKYVLRPTDEYGTWANNTSKTGVTFSPKTLSGVATVGLSGSTMYVGAAG